MKVENMTSGNGNKIANQFIITDEGHGALGNFINRVVFQSYDSVIVRKTNWEGKIKTELDEKYWDYSKTTGKYRNLFLAESTKETEKKIASGEYILTDLN